MAKLSNKTFMPIPDAPNYAINGKRDIINLKTGKPVKKYYRESRNYWLAIVYNNGKEIKRSVETFYRQALDAFNGTHAMWKAIPSLKCQYEISAGSDVRNVKTKRVIKEQHNGRYVYVCIQLQGKQGRFPVKKLWAEVFDGDYRRRSRAIPVQVSKGGQQWHFPTIESCAEFLTKKVFYCKDVIRKKMHRREPGIFGYSVKYY